MSVFVYVCVKYEKGLQAEQIDLSHLIHTYHHFILQLSQYKAPDNIY